MASSFVIKGSTGGTYTIMDSVAGASAAAIGTVTIPTGSSPGTATWQVPSAYKPADGTHTFTVVPSTGTTGSATISLLGGAFVSSAPTSVRYLHRSGAARIAKASPPCC